MFYLLPSEFLESYINLMILVVVLLLYEYGDFVLYEHRDMDGFEYRDVYRVGLKDRDVMRDKIWYLDRELYRVWDFLFDCDWNFLFNYNWVGFGDVHRDRYFLLDMYRKMNFDRDRDFLFYGVRDWVWYRYFDFLSDCDRFDFPFFGIPLATSEKISFLRPAVAETFASRKKSHVSQTLETSFCCFVLLLLFCQSQGNSQKKGADLKVE